MKKILQFLRILPKPLKRHKWGQEYTWYSFNCPYDWQKCEVCGKTRIKKAYCRELEKERIEFHLSVTPCLK